VSLKSSPDAIPDFKVVDDPQDIRLIFSKKHNIILKQVMEREMSISDISRALDLNPGSVHYHLKELEKRGLVRQVREEIKGGVVKKFYRSSAKRLLLDSTDFSKMGVLESGDIAGLNGRLIRAIEYMGYHLSPENTDDAEEMLTRMDKRIKTLLTEIYGSGLESSDDDALIINNACQIMLILRSKEDHEIDRIYNEFHKLFIKYE
jgi:DNA-binding transcriptional ArsR family regulator